MRSGTEGANLPGTVTGGWSMKVGRAVTAVLVSLAVVFGSDAAASGEAYTVRAGSPPAGNDVSYPQCSQTLPSGQAFGIVAVNDGLANNTNPCLAAELSWAQASTGAAGQPRVSLYVNTADPGPSGLTDWPTNNDDPVYGNPVADPYGRCTGGNDAACAWQYGWNLADFDAQTRGVPSPGSYRWWIDVETLNSWQSSARDNRADLEGMVSYFRSIGATAGLYSTSKQWDPIVGTVPRTSPLYRLPDWRPGAKTLAQAQKNCRLTPLTGGGTVAVTQWKNRPANSDFSCPGKRSRHR